MPTLTQAEIAEKERELVTEGWTRQFTTFPNRVQEYLDLYGAMELEVRVEPWALTLDEDPSCSSCALTGVMRTIFTRRKADL
ncbi:MAG: hypothetical protein HY782_06565 [Chloroflexi bacterium]|nr:hypothetical protein [Chloroflexota bacterium]